ncbi:Pyrroline-5-carboxylate reductase [Nereida ignava]|uniref:Pyrroline-5-carboxylate reductase n=1 Tax=Nereida ignava TaxID=282199 RepID=A0A0U1NNH2_9RHOB|nr:pyrroline-5-carboxylate reductase [Nereida ignava]CRK76043.1 Pyrroline-5-carboxylate reductase [Nereida ignava]SFJ66128.1 pyrroline-5-carboxylate reductase [Nereida ignava DSM 16309]
MNLEQIEQRGMVLLGCGKMGSAMLRGWLADGLSTQAVSVLDPFPSAWLNECGVRVNQELPTNPALVLIAVKPQMMGDALPQMQALGNGDSVFLSVAAGVTLANFSSVLGPKTPIIRAMPNTPAAVGAGITALIGNAETTPDHLDMAEALLRAVGQVVRLDNEDQMDAVTGVSGSGPAYVFHMIEALAAAGQAQGLGADLAMQLAKATVAGAGQLAAASEETPSELRVNVTSPNGTTQAGLEVLMDEKHGLGPLMSKTVAAATTRSKELANG